MNRKRILVIAVAVIVIAGISAVSTIQMAEVRTPASFSVEDQHEIDTALSTETTAEGVVIYTAARQICTQRMGCTCKHKRSSTDTLKSHKPEEDPYDDQNSWSPHLDIKCTKCSSEWYCPVWNRFRGS
jgi:uncharacterized secreted protein with C-terminal beta-propeller domain